MQKKKTAYVSPNIAGILSLFDPALDWSADLSGDEYATALKEFLVVHQEGSKDPRKDDDIETDVLEGIREEYNRVRKNKDLEYSVKKTKIKGNKLMGKETKKDAPPITDPSKLLSGVGNFNSEDIKPDDVEPPADVDKKQKDLDLDKLNSIAKTVESIALLLRRQLGLEKKQQRDTRKQQDKLNKEARESELESKPDKKTGGLPKAIAKPALGFFERIKKFFLNIVIGSAVLKLFNWLKDPANQEKIIQFKDFLIDNAPLIIGALAGLALLPIVSSLVGLVGGIMGGLSMLGFAVPLLPIILKGILIAAVAALAIAAVSWFAKKIVGGSGFKRARDLNKKRLLKAGINVQGNVKDEKGLTIRAPIFGENSLTGREWREEDTFWAGPNETAKVNLINGTISKIDGNTVITPQQHQDWYAANYGEESLDAKLGAYAKYETTKDDIISKQKQMEAKVKEEILTEKERQAIASESSGLVAGFWGLRNPNKYRGEEYNERVILHRKILNDLKRENINVETKIRNAFNKEAMVIFNESKKINSNINDKQLETIDIDDKQNEQTLETIDIDEQTSATIDKDIKPNTNVPGPFNKDKGGKISVIPGGGGGQTQSGGGGGGNSQSSTVVPSFSSVDLLNNQTVAVQSLYSKVAVD